MSKTNARTFSVVIGHGSDEFSPLKMSIQWAKSRLQLKSGRRLYCLSFVVQDVKMLPFVFQIPEYIPRAVAYATSTRPSDLHGSLEKFYNSAFAFNDVTEAEILHLIAMALTERSVPGLIKQPWTVSIQTGETHERLSNKIASVCSDFDRAFRHGAPARGSL